MKSCRFFVLFTITIAIFSMVIFVFSFCQRAVFTQVPNYPVFFKLDMNSVQAKSLRTPGGYILVTQSDMVYSSIGFGGLLIVRGTFINNNQTDFYAYDLCCPYETQRDIRVFVNEKLNAECPVCHSEYSILYGGGNVISGKSKGPLRTYKSYLSENTLFVVN